MIDDDLLEGKIKSIDIHLQLMRLLFFSFNNIGQLISNKIIVAIFRNGL